jgi:hypothetical protein
MNDNYYSAENTDNYADYYNTEVAQNVNEQNYNIYSENYTNNNQNSNTYAFRKLQKSMNLDEEKKHFGGILCDNDKNLKKFVSNVLIKNTSSYKISDNIGKIFKLKGFFSESITFKNGKIGNFTLLFGVDENNKMCAFNSSSMKIVEALQKMQLVYGEPKDWEQTGIMVKIRSNYNENVESFTLEIVDNMEENS